MLERPASNAASIIWPRFDAESHALAGLYAASNAAATRVIFEPAAVYSGAVSLTAAQSVPAAVNP